MLSATPAGTVWAHGDVTPQAVDTKSLPQLGDDWRPDNPIAPGQSNRRPSVLAARPTTRDCARCHGLEAVSGGIAPDLRKLDSDCVSLADAKKKQACMTEISQYFTTTVRKGRTRDGRVYMPPFDGVLSQEAVWAIKTYLESRHE
ncbi:cytochrome c-550 PedF [Cupriavidus basilensis]